MVSPLEVAAAPSTILAPTGDIPRERRIFVNRTLRLDKIDLIGFDMDWTLAVYREEAIHRLSIEATLAKLVDRKGYPPEILRIDYDPFFTIRGLCVDKEQGNLFKMDRHGHVGRVLHGRRPLSKERRHALYRTGNIRVRPPRYAWVDSLFALPEGAIYARLVDWRDERVAAMGSAPGYERLWDDIRECIDEAHRDDSMKGLIKQAVATFIERDPELPATLHKFRSAGRRLFLLTNSEWHYTDALMTHLLGGSSPLGYPSWRHYFDIVIVASQKPRFFTDRTPFVAIDEAGHALGEASSFVRGHVYQGGNLVDFEEYAGVCGDRILYVGDHIYGDMLRSKRASAWRTALIVQELEGEIRQIDAMRERGAMLEELDRRRARLDADVSFHQGRLKGLQRAGASPRPAGPGASPGPEGRAEKSPPSRALDAAKRGEKEKLDRLRAELRDTLARVEQLEALIDRQFHSWWGPLFKEGHENSKFGEQVEDYACVYTGRVSNFLAYSPLAYLRAAREYLPHELALPSADAAEP